MSTVVSPVKQSACVSLVITNVFLTLLPSPLLGERGFALYFDWRFSWRRNALPRFLGLNESPDQKLVSGNSTPHPPAPSPRNGRNGARGRKHLVRLNPMEVQKRWGCLLTILGKRCIQERLT